MGLPPGFSRKFKYRLSWTSRVDVFKFSNLKQPGLAVVIAFDTTLDHKAVAKPVFGIILDSFLPIHATEVVDLSFIDAPQIKAPAVEVDPHAPFP